jgi:isoprenylcysteine carboxyl methyltransferase (ICMT) family protein YpbQ
VPSTDAVPRRLARPIALGGLLFFIGALVYFAYCYVVLFGREVAGTTSPRAVAADVMLFTVFALHHSLFARDAIRKRISRTVGALERSTYVWIASPLFIAVCAWWQPIAGAAWRIDEPALVWLLRAAQLLGVWLTLRSALMIDVLELAGLTQVRRVRQDPPSTADFKTSGPYGWVRHPIYAGWFLFVFAIPLMTMTRFVFAITSSLYLLIAIPFEERSLRCSSAGAYERYMKQVRWKLLPHVF